MADTHHPSLRQVITQIADQLCDTIDNNFDIHVSVDTQDTEGQKLALLVNFLLENVRRSLTDMQSLNEQLEDKVKERTSLLDLILAGSNDGVWIWDIANDELTLSGRWYSMLELPHDANTQSPEFWYQQIHPADRERFSNAIRGLRKGESEHLNVEYRVKTTRHGYRWMLCRGVCQKDNEQQCSIVAGTQTDISAMRIFDQESGMPNERYLRERVEDALDEQQPLFLIYVTVENIDAILNASEHASNARLYPVIQERLNHINGLHLVASKL
uniref:PAS domain-containing protein n=1 Tax=Idiomarina sp. TaxID=1874361 RepID=UPI00258B859A